MAMLVKWRGLFLRSMTEGRHTQTSNYSRNVHVRSQNHEKNPWRLFHHQPDGHCETHFVVRVIINPFFLWINPERGG